ncbi:hypothetical protein CCZ01_07090 [Helicobacter monodelphidis]|uniref:DUF4143 domain-containing protein n=1 Tax=Helicobacter sp. 15-1451 TaxID=2004995 RepID=UPI000DCD19D6|nr:ATP-binding protein [Helicobacter sp. 15-1451]RAX57102.1 hypothetical protein CCZ01_07090 [Helicobacter sp. 15-1451]
MEILEKILKRDKMEHGKYFRRKLSLPFCENSPSREVLNLYGAPRVGKSVLARMTADYFKTPLILECKDPRITPFLANIMDALPAFIKEHCNDILILDDWDNLESLQESTLSLLNHIPISILVVSKLPIDHFTTFQLYGIDFEEYISFSHHPLELEHLFNSFLHDGTLLEISLLEEYKKDYRKQEIIQLIQCEKQGKHNILLSILPYMGHKVTPHHLYTQVKKSFSISKDTIYSLIKYYKDASLLFLLSKFDQSSAAKKLYFWDFSLSNAISYERNFSALFENMIFLELLKTKYHIYYGDTLEFLLLNNFHSSQHSYVGVLVAPFLSFEAILKRLKKVKKEFPFLSKVFVITLGLNQEGENEHILYRILPFWEFALGDKEW